MGNEKRKREKVCTLPTCFEKKEQIKSGNAHAGSNGMEIWVCGSFEMQLIAKQYTAH